MPKFLKYALYTILWLQINPIFSQGIYNSTGGALINSLARITSTSNSIESIYGNPSGLVHTDHTYGFDIGFQRKFNVEDLSTINIGGFRKLNSSALGISYAQFGNKYFLQHRVDFIYSRLLTKSLMIGTRISGIRYDLKEFGNSNNISVDLGVSYHINKSILLGCSMINPFSFKEDEDYFIPTAIALGVRYTPWSNLNFLVEIEQQLEQDINVKTAVNYKLNSVFETFVGANLEDESFNFGLRFRFNQFHILGNFSTQQKIGNTPSMSFSYLR